MFLLSGISKSQNESWGIEFFKNNLFYFGRPYYKKGTKHHNVLMQYYSHLADDLSWRLRHKHSSVKSGIFEQVDKSRRYGNTNVFFTSCMIILIDINRVSSPILVSYLPLLVLSNHLSKKFLAHMSHLPQCWTRLSHCHLLAIAVPANSAQFQLIAWYSC